MSIKFTGSFAPITGAMKAGDLSSTSISQVETLVVAGGGGGGRHSGAGGGAGGLIYDATYSVTPGASYNITVGTGGECAYGSYPTVDGAVGTNGTNSVFSTLTAIGGGGGGYYATTGSLGGSGGGSSRDLGAGGLGTAGQGFAGGTGTVSAPNYPASGGGGAGGAGDNHVSTSGGGGGIGLQYSISGTSLFYAGGGGGCIQNNGSYAAAPGGSGVGGEGANIFAEYGFDGAVNTGSGGGGANYNPTGSGPAGQQSRGAAGVVVIRYAGAIAASGGTITIDGGFTVHTFNETGVFNTSEIGAVTTTFRYWRIATSIPVQYVTIVEVEMFEESVGGSDVTTEGFAEADSVFNGSYLADNAFDNSLVFGAGTRWNANNIGVSTRWIGQDFGAGNEKDIKRITVTGGHAGTNFDLQYSPNGVNWTTLVADMEFPDDSGATTYTITV